MKKKKNTSEEETSLMYESEATNARRATLRQGDSGESVKELQRMLVQLGYLQGVVDGIFGPKTTAAVKRFQINNNLVADGVVGKNTWAKLDEENPRVTKPTLRQGSTGQYVVELQSKLISLGYLQGVADGIFGAGTKLAVQRFQQANGLTADGVVGAGTWAKLDSITPVRPTLRQGSTGQYVVELQQMLIRYGFLQGVADGIFGAGTAEAVKRFQAAVGLTADGVVGQGTWNALDNYTPSGGENRPTLREGDAGEYVVALQRRLKELGYYTGIVTGIFDSETKLAVQAFQDSSGLYPDGVVGKGTWEKLNITEIPDVRPTLREGDRGLYVEMLQRELKELGFYKGEITGIFDSATKAAVKEFQTYVGIQSDGIVGEGTWIAIDNELSKPSIPTEIIREGDSGTLVSILQEKLKILEYYNGSITGSFGEMTKEAVMEFQRDNGLTPDGVVGPATWIKLYAETENPPDPELPPGPKPTLRYGDNNEYVKVVQRILKRLMIYDGEITGNFDNKTLIAVKSFQSLNKLTADGVVGLSTWSALYSTNPPTINCQ